MAKKKKSSGGGGGEGGGQQPKPAEEAEEKAVGDHDDENDKDKKNDKEKGKKAPVVTAVLKVDMHCDGCAKRIRDSVRRYPGVEGVAMDVDKGTMTVVGRVDAKKLRDRVAKKTKKNVELVVNQNKGKDDDDNKKQNQDKGDKAGSGGGGDGKEKTKEDKDPGGGGKGKGGKDTKKPVVPVVGTVVLKIGAMGLHCDGCMNRVRAKLFKIKGVEQVAMDRAKNQVTVTGTMDTKALPGKLQKKVRRPVDVVQPNKDKEGKDKQEGKDKEGSKDGKEKEKEKDAASKALTAEIELWKTAFYDQQALLNTELMLSDENPNACSVM